MTTNGRNGGAVPGDAERDSRLDRLYRETAREGPPASLDAAILAAARREVGARPRAITARLRAWRVPVSIAAVVVLSVSLVTLVREEGGGPTEPLSGVDLDSKRAETASAPPKPAKSLAGTAPPAAAPSASDDVALGATASAEMAGNAARRDDPERARPSAAPEPQPRAVAPPPRPFPAAPAAREQRPALTADLAAGAVPATPSSGILGGEAESSAKPAEPTPERGPAARIMQQDRAAMADEADTVSGLRSPAAAAPAAKSRALDETRTLQSARPRAEVARIAALVREFESQPPEKWLEKIDALRREGRKGEADDLLAEFKRRFPDHPLPAALR